jgi:hypothetical protein
MCDGTFDEVDFQFTIGGEEFQQLWLLVDGIYPPLSRFVKPISVPIGDTEALFSMWQEVKRKDVERSFGVLKKNSLICKADSIGLHRGHFGCLLLLSIFT